MQTSRWGEGSLGPWLWLDRVMLLLWSSRACSRHAGQHSGCCTGSFLQRGDDTAAYPLGTWDQLSAQLQPSNVAAESCHAATEVFTL